MLKQETTDISVSKNIVNKKGAKEIFDLDKTSDQIKKAIIVIQNSRIHQILFYHNVRKESENLLIQQIVYLCPLLFQDGLVVH